MADSTDAAAKLLERVAASAASPTPGKDLPVGASHNNYSLYVHHPDDLIGLVAYSLYKQHKISFFQSELERTSLPATEEKTKTFCDVYSEAQQVELLRERASGLLEKMTEEVLNEAVGKLNLSYERQLKAELKAGMPLHKSVYHSVVGNLVTGVIIATAVWIATSSFDDLLAAGKKLFTTEQRVQTEKTSAGN